MTPLPVVERRRVEAAETTAPEATGEPARRRWPQPPRQGTCAHPRCHRASGQRHHAVARGVLFGPYDYVYIDDKRVINVVDLCVEHHEQLESAPGGCKARLRWLDTGWGWYDRYKGDDRTHIFWTDAKHQTLWTFEGFLGGEFLCQ